METKRKKSTGAYAAALAVFAAALLILAALSGCGAREQNKLIKIAVMGNPDEFPPQYEDGIKAGAKEADAEYSEKGYRVECEFYGDGGSYGEGAAVIDSLAYDGEITAIIGSRNMDINKTAAHVYSKADKLFVVPFFLYDSVYDNNNYSMIFSMCNSAGTVGECLRAAAANTAAKRWAVCAAENEFSTAEMNGFIGGSADDGIQTVDCVGMRTLENDFDGVFKRWKTLGVEGVMMFPGDERGFELLKAIRGREPNMVCGGDTMFDDHEILLARPDIMSIMPGFIMANEYDYKDISADGRNAFEIAEKYSSEAKDGFDSWFLQGYNAVRMVADTAAEADTTNGARIAELLHENGYNGLCQNFKFDEKGKQSSDKYLYFVFAEEGLSERIEVDK